jgi:hypothetical protein
VITGDPLGVHLLHSCAVVVGSATTLVSPNTPSPGITSTFRLTVLTLPFAGYQYWEGCRLEIQKMKQVLLSPFFVWLLLP